MNRIDRLTAILILLQTKSIISSTEIADRFEISKRTVYRDIRALEEAGVPIGSEAGKGYFIVDGYRLPPVMFTREEAGSMLIAHKLIDKFTDISIRKNFNLAIDKIKAVMREYEKEYLNSLEDRIAVFNFIVPENENRSDNFLGLIQNALALKKCLRIDYFASYSQESTKNRIVDPLGLVFYGNTWHLIGYCKLRNDMRDFRVDRIRKMEITEECAGNNKPGDLAGYLKEWWKETDLFEVKVLFKHSVTNDILTSKYYFGFLSEIKTEHGIQMTFAVNDYHYIANWLLTFGDQIKIILPAELNRLLTEKVRILKKAYLSHEYSNSQHQ